jgi:hypothetical protein
MTAAVYLPLNSSKVLKPGPSHHQGWAPHCPHQEHPLPQAMAHVMGSHRRHPGCKASRWPGRAAQAAALVQPAGGRPPCPLVAPLHLGRSSRPSRCLQAQAATPPRPQVSSLCHELPLHASLGKLGVLGARVPKGRLPQLPCLGGSAQRQQRRRCKAARHPPGGLHRRIGSPWRTWMS